MKKYLLTIFCLAYAFIVYAGPVSENQALAKACQFMPGKGFVLAKSAESKARPGQGNGSTPYYVFNAEDNGGFVIVSGDDRTKPILGYSESGALDEDNLPENVASWLDYYAKAISALENCNVEPVSATKTKRNSVEPLLTTKWNQTSPYNNQCIFNGDVCMTGCVATAMAQVVNYFKYPKKVKAIEGYTKGSYTIPSLDAATISWKNMCPTYYSYDNRTEAQKDAVATLMRYCGQSVLMYYGPNSSGSSELRVPSALVKYFGYSKSAHVIYQVGYSPEEWENEIYQELAAGYPIIYCGTAADDCGHCFVLDGYKDGTYHVNWGWGGYCNGYFVLTVMDSRGPDHPDWAFGGNQTAVVGVRPFKGGTLDYPLMTVNHIRLMSANEITRGSKNENFEVNIRLGFWINSEDAVLGGVFALYKGDKKVQTLTEPRILLFPPNLYETTTLNLSFGANLADGKYRIEALYYDKDSVCHKPQGFGYRYTEAVIKGNKLTLTNYPLIGTVKLNKSKVTIQKGKTVTLKATVSPSTLSDKSVTWTSSNTKVATVTSEGKVKGVKAGTATITCTSSTGLSATCKVTVGYVKLDKTKASVKKGKTLTLTPTVYPSSLSDKSVTWKSSDTSIATVTTAGKVKGVKYGTATITCTSNATGLSTTCKVTVGAVTLSKTKASVKKGKTVTLKATVYPSSLSNKKVTWESSNTKIATVTSAGKVKGVKAGTVTITCTSNATGLSATCTVTVTKSSGSRSLDGDDDAVTGIEEEMIDDPVVIEPFDVYDLSGRKVLHQVTSLDGLPDGIYIVNGRKILKK